MKTSFIYDIISGKSANPSTVKLARVADSLGIALKSLVEKAETVIPAVFSAPSSTDFFSIPRLIVDSTHPETAISSQHVSDEPYSFRKSWLVEHLKVAPENLRLLSIAGDSMDPTLVHADIVLIDTASTHPNPPGIFIIYDGFSLAPKRLELLSHLPRAKIRLISDNPQYTTYVKSVEDIAIIGRVVWFARGI